MINGSQWGSISIIVKAIKASWMLLAPSSIGRKLLLSYIALGSLIVLSTIIGVSGFRFVEKTEQKVVTSALPSVVEAHQVSVLSAQIIATVQELLNSKTELGRQQAKLKAFEKLTSLLAHIDSLKGEFFSPEIIKRLKNNVQSIVNIMAKLEASVEQKLWLSVEIAKQVEQMRTLSDELEQLTRTQVANTSTVAVANVTHIYDLLETEEQTAILDALDTLVEVDLDLSSRLHELHLRTYRLVTQIEESKTVADSARIEALQHHFVRTLKIIERRVIAVEDPTRLAQMQSLVKQLRAKQSVFSLMRQRSDNGELSQALSQKSFAYFSALNATVNELMDASNQGTTKAISELNQTLNIARFSLIAISLLSLVIIAAIVWRVVYLSVVRRLDSYSNALQKITHHDLDVDLDIRGHDELARMGQAIIKARDTAKELQIVGKAETEARMALEDHKAHLEQEVEERTQQLVEANDKLNDEIINHTRARNDAEQANRAKSAFLAVMSHEIRTPMNGVLGTVQLLKQAELNSRQQHYVDVIDRSGNALLELLNDILDYSKIEAGKLTIRSKPMDFRTAIQDVYELFLGRAEQKQIELSLVIESSVQGFYLGDEVRLRQILSNLLGNAIKFTSSGHVDIYVVEGERGEVQIEVTDTGEGIDPAYQATLFEPFVQVENERMKATGTGLGLAICKKLVDAMNGNISLVSELGVGSTFSFSLPLERIQHDPSVAMLVENKSAEPISKKLRILLVEDNPVNSMVAEGFLTHAGHTVESAETGAEAIRLFSRAKFDLALLDINLPDCDGVELMHQLKAIETENNTTTITPMIAVSAHVYEEDVESYLSAGFIDYVAKPIKMTSLLDAVNKAHLFTDITPSLCVNTPSKSDDNPTCSANEDVPLIDYVCIDADVKVLGISKMREIIQLFITSSQDIVEQLALEFEQGNSQRIKDLAHKLKGSASSVGLNRLSAICAEIEKSSDAEQGYQERKSELIAALSASVEKLARY